MKILISALIIGIAAGLLGALHFLLVLFRIFFVTKDVVGNTYF